jgi:hypothetical protein
VPFPGGVTGGSLFAWIILLISIVELVGGNFVALPSPPNVATFSSELIAILFS